MEALATARLDLRPFTAADVEEMLPVYGDAQVMRWVGHGVVAGRAAVSRMLAEYADHQGRYGFSVWAVRERATGMLVGDAGLHRRADGAVELGYTLRRDAWGRGLATEVAAAWVQAAFGPLGLPALVAQADVPNAASHRVLEKAGFQADGTRTVYGRPHRVFCAAPR